ncbi:MAG: YqeG family HAD IIIA-type phosphatase [Lachnospiraceae bacterium]|nr:YqeG family HAD IIIA-type phosphatase [Lachnospiraceae bacterium]
MFQKFFPDEWVASTYALPFEKMYEAGKRALIFDIDNTLVPHGAPADERAKELFERLHAIGFRITLLSNNKEPRVKSFCEDVVGAEYIYKANKPAKGGYETAMKNMGTVPSTTVFIGDQLFTDVWGAKRCGIHSILVNPIEKKEEIQIVIKRRFEAIVMHFYKKKCDREHIEYPKDRRPER